MKRTLFLCDIAHYLERLEIEMILKDIIEKGTIPPYVYSYPTRSSYRKIEGYSVEQIWHEDKLNSVTNDLNLYLHVPFCHYKCGYCNLYTVISKDVDVYDAYTNALCEHIRLNKSIIQSRTLRTVYIGGGTPSLLSERHFVQIFETLSEIYPNWRNSTYEVCLEATPDSVVDNPQRIQFLVNHGVTRINLGVQSLQPNELKEAGRSKANVDVVREAIKIIKKSELANLSTDLINGFMGQNEESWKSSVKSLVELSPETISTYFLTIRPDANFSKIGKYSYYRDPELYSRYDWARDHILAAGYVQETNIRYKKQGRGGYIQKALQFRGVPYLGLGVGARTYTNTVDYLVSTDTQASIPKMQKYMDDVNSGNVMTPSVGFIYNDEERIRKRLVLDLFDIDLQQLQTYDYDKYAHKFEPILEEALSLGLLQKIGDTRYQLTSNGYKYRDIISWAFFSDNMTKLDHEFYTNLHNSDARVKKSMPETPNFFGADA